MGLFPEAASVVAMKKTLSHGFLIKRKKNYLIEQIVILILIIG